MSARAHALLSVAALTCASAAIAANTPETEPNDTKAAANGPIVLSPGDTISGTSTGTSTTVPGLASADNFLVSTAAAKAGIYRHRLVLTSSTVGHSVSIRGLGQTAAPQAPWYPNQAIGSANAVDAAAQSGSTTTTPPRMVQWYGFGAQEQLYYRVTGTGTTTAPYTATYERQPVTVGEVGTLNPGFITITTIGQGHTSDTDLWVYDGNLNAITGFGNDDEAAAAVSEVPGTLGTSLQSVLRREYAPGTYYIAISNWNLAIGSPSPSDDDYRTGTLLDFPGAILNSSTTTNVNVSFSVTDGKNTYPVAATKTGAFDVLFFRFTVGGGSACPADLDNNGEVGAGDLTRLLGAWGTFDYDLDGDGGPTGAGDLSVLLGAWGDCP
jgi:hypothetical protein